MKRTALLAAAIGAAAVFGVGGAALASASTGGTGSAGTGSAGAGSAGAGSAGAGSAGTGSASAGAGAGTDGLAMDDHGVDAVTPAPATGDDFGLRGDGTVDDDPAKVATPSVSPTSRVGFGLATSPAPAVSPDRHGGRATGDDDVTGDRHGGRDTADDNNRHGGDDRGGH